MTARQKPGWYLRTLLTACGFVLIAGYIYFQIVRSAHGTDLRITTPISGALLSSPLLGVSGEARNATLVSINGREIFTDESGHFAEELLLAEGLNTITVRAQDRFGNIREETREVVYHSNKTPQEPAADHEARGDGGKTNL